MKTITSFSIEGLHGVLNVQVPIEDGVVILVGVNGLGKTTIVSMLYYLLTRQWSKLLEFDFKRISVSLAGENISLDRAFLSYPDASWQHSLFDSLPLSVAERLLSSPDFFLLMNSSEHAKREDVSRVAKKIDLPIQLVERALMSSILRTHSGGTRKQKKTGKVIQEIESKLTGLGAQVLYLPTYRRIEQDLKSLFPEHESDFRKAVRSRVGRDSRAGYVELVEFGMEDVDSRVKAKVASLKDGSRVELNNLAGGYLRDVIRGEARDWSGEKITRLSDSEVKLILGRVEEKQLNEADKDKVFEVINLVKNERELNSDNELLAHFFSKLVDIHETQQIAEIPLRQFVDVCNKYLQSKNFIFDDANYDLRLELESGARIEMRSLSSGEKQIVSIFANIYLGDSNNYCLIIDEPELSLSVEWQKTLLPDIMNSGRCIFLAAVTHSPFIYQNNLFDYAKDLAGLQEFIS